MHELSLAYNICETVRSHAPEGQRVLSVVVECGPLSGVVPEALRFGFSIASKEHGLEAAELDLRLLPAAASCPVCNARFSVDAMWAVCPDCGQGPVTVEGGTELRIKEIEVEENDDV